MPSERYDFGLAATIGAEAIGPPGQRRFRLTVQNDEASAALWLEKEQLAALGTALDQQLARTRGAKGPSPSSAAAEPPPFPLNPSVDLQVGQLSLGYDDSRHVFVLQIYALDADAGGQATFSCAASRDQARRLIDEIARLMAAGRPVCPLCGAPIQGAHVCPRANGHARAVTG
jgi:uncharacterized repeat protein (TIGR03847 family)